MAHKTTPGTKLRALLGLTDLLARLGSEGKVGAVLFSTYCFEYMVNEVSRHPRPASHRLKIAVETDHPLYSFPTLTLHAASASKYFEKTSATKMRVSRTNKYMAKMNNKSMDSAK